MGKSPQNNLCRWACTALGSLTHVIVTILSGPFRGAPEPDVLMPTVLYSAIAGILRAPPHMCPCTQKACCAGDTKIQRMTSSLASEASALASKGSLRVRQDPPVWRLALPVTL